MSTCDTIHELSNHVVQSNNNNKRVSTIFLDPVKAFEDICLSALLMKLEAVGVRGAQLDLFRSYLNNRSQFVKINNYNSSVVVSVDFLFGTVGPREVF